MAADSSSPDADAYTDGVEQDEMALAPVISSLVNGFSMYESTVVVLHVRAGTSLFAAVSRKRFK